VSSFGEEIDIGLSNLVREHAYLSPCAELCGIIARRNRG
jgi:hypothetical protein